MPKRMRKRRTSPGFRSKTWDLDKGVRGCDRRGRFVVIGQLGTVAKATLRRERDQAGRMESVAVIDRPSRSVPRLLHSARSNGR